MFLTIITLYFWLFFQVLLNVGTMLGALLYKFILILIYFLSDINHHILQLLGRVPVN
jgi:hypothetical protein